MLGKEGLIYIQTDDQDGAYIASQVTIIGERAIIEEWDGNQFNTVEIKTEDLVHIRSMGRMKDLNKAQSLEGE